jgi:hypothetical protein
MSRLTRVLLVSAAAALVAVAAPVLAASKKGECGPGQTAYAGKCVAACPTEGRFAAAGCECPAGWSKLMVGSDAAECHRNACEVSGPIRDPKACDCPRGYEKKKGGKETRCVAKKSAAER